MTLSFASYSLIVTFSAEFVGGWRRCDHSFELVVCALELYLLSVA
ncbi:hypothetical protein [Coleofasciculus sp. FACHB-SPT9]|nr:hypothetical protein [Coleofasciculus sp. FACHB-SPT9]